MGEYKIFAEEICIEKDLKYKNITVLKYKIIYPKFSTNSASNFIHRINRYYRDIAFRLLQYCENIMYISAVKLYKESLKNDFPFHTFEFYNICKITYDRDCIISLYQDRYKYESGANGNTTRSSDSWDIQNEKRITLSSLFPGVHNVRKYIIDEITDKIIANIKNNTGDYLLFDEKPQKNNIEKLVDKYLDEKNFYITKSGVDIYFQEITIAPHSQGIVVFSFPFDSTKAVKPSCIHVQNNDDNGINQYKIKSDLLQSSMDRVGVFHPIQAATIWADGLKNRTAALQYSVMETELKIEYAKKLDENNQNWVTGISSPWIEKYTILKENPLQENPNELQTYYKIKFDTATSDGFWDSYYAEIIIIREDGFARISKINADDGLNIYMGY